MDMPELPRPDPENLSAEQEREAVRQAFLAWLDCYARRDPEGMLSCMKPSADLLCVGTGQEEIVEGWDALAEGYRRDVLQAPQIAVGTPEILRVAVAPQMAYVFFQSTNVFTLDGAHIPIRTRRTVVFEKMGPRWVQSHTHHSAPDIAQPTGSSYPLHLGRRYHFLSEHLRDMILFVRERDGAILETNRAAEIAYDYSAEDFAAMTVTMLMTPSSRKRYEAWRSGRHPVPSVLEMDHRRRGGMLFPVEASLQRVEEGSETLVLMVLRDITERQRLLTELRHAASHDGLTGILNRPHFETILRRDLERSHRYGTPLTLIMFDLDHFKILNDTRGHESGDRVLQEVCARVAERLRGTDSFARWGGEEFMVLASVNAVGAQRLADDLRRTLDDRPFSHGERVTASFGVATYEPGLSLEALVARADEALYRAKAAGRNTVRIAGEEAVRDGL